MITFSFGMTSKSLWNDETEAFTQLTTENNKVLSAKRFKSKFSPCSKLFLKMREKRGAGTE